MDSETCIDPIKILVHNVSHADLCICIQSGHVISPTRDTEIIARPRSSRFRYVCEQLIQVINKGAKFRGISFKNQINNYNLYQSSPLSTPKEYFGIEFINPPSICSWQDFRLKDRYNNYPTSSRSLTIVITKVFFPLISVILPKWMSLHEPSNETTQVLPTPEQGRYPSLSLKKSESSESDQTANGDDQDSHDTSSHDMFINGPINGLINGSATDNGNDKIRNKGKDKHKGKGKNFHLGVNRKYNNSKGEWNSSSPFHTSVICNANTGKKYFDSASEDDNNYDNYDISRRRKHVSVNDRTKRKTTSGLSWSPRDFSSQAAKKLDGIENENENENEEKQMLFINCNENETENTPELVEMSPSPRPTVGMDNINSSNDEIVANTSGSRNHGIRILHTGMHCLTFDFDFGCLYGYLFFFLFFC